MVSIQSDDEENSLQQSSEEEFLSATDEPAPAIKSASEGLSDAGILNDAKLNQEVIKLRSVARKSKGKIIQSVIRKARKLQKTTESNPKNLKKAENLIESVNGLKTLLADPITKFAISHTQAECNSIISSDTEEMSKKALARVANETNLRSKINQVASKYKNWSTAVAKFLEGNEKVPKNKTTVKSIEKVTSTKEKKPVKEKQKVAKATPTSTDDNDKPAAETKKDVKPVQKPQAVTPSKKSAVSNLVKTAVVKRLQDLDELENLESFDKTVTANDVHEKTSKKDSFFLSSDGHEVSSDEEPIAESESEDEEKFQDRSYKSRAYHVRNKDNAEKPSMGSLNSHPRNNSFAKNFQDSSHKDRSRKPPPAASRVPYNKPDRKPAEPASEKLHPSWEAKRKQQAISIMSAPTNKKIKFD